ncbi:hypothetical protein [Pyxidicoccus fallax]|uniref:hypothetical protein n=1 Tax=Pyxidicoccus fallax TaxID=394095 RepID=UPI001FE4535B|nr:hypothetical protein [Pyxidicoccus fallax]
MKVKWKSSGFLVAHHARSSQKLSKTSRKLRSGCSGASSKSTRAMRQSSVSAHWRTSRAKPALLP